MSVLEILNHSFWTIAFAFVKLLVTEFFCIESLITLRAPRISFVGLVLGDLRKMFKKMMGSKGGGGILTYFLVYPF